MNEHFDDFTLLFVKRMDEAYEQMHKNLNISLYADSPGWEYKRSKPTIRQRLSAFKDRAHDAWLVLIGRADIGY